MEYFFGDTAIRYETKGECAYGENVVLLKQDDNLIAGTSWAATGYAIVPLLSPAEYTDLLTGIRSILGIILRALGTPWPDDVPLDQYHTLVDEALHERVIERTSYFSSHILPFDYEQLLKRMGDELGLPVTSENPSTGVELFHLRIVRPNSGDNNPLHRDVWLDRLRNGVNIYLPIAGSNANSSLCLVPGSHLWPESDIERTASGAEGYTVPAVSGSRQKLEVDRPDPQGGEVLLFSPYLVHGGAVNLNADTTRISLEMRFWRVDI